MHCLVRPDTSGWCATLVDSCMRGGHASPEEGPPSVDNETSTPMLKLKPESYRWALRHALHEGDTDVLPRPFEYRALEHDWDAVESFLAKQNVLQWTTRPHRRILSPKARHAFRVITQLDPLDFLVFTALIREVGRDLEASRVPIESDRVFSYRFKPLKTGRMFDRSVGYVAFQNRCRAKLEDDAITHVAVADIADFYPRIYHHRLENALNAATTKTNHVLAIKNLVKSWNTTETFGIPVGGAGARMLAEVTIANIDQLLLALEIDYVRFNDDFRIFVKSERDGYRALVALADALYTMHGLTLQPQKTTILTREEFGTRYQIDPEDRELNSLSEKFEELVRALDLDDPYEEIDYDDLDEDQKELVDSMNLIELFRETIDDEGEPDTALLRFILRRLAQLKDNEVVDEALDNIRRLHHVFPDIVEYVRALDLDQREKRRIGGRLLTLMRDTAIGDLPCHQIWGYDLFATDSGWNHADQFMRLLNRAQDDWQKRQLILALGRSGQRPWFQRNWRSLLDWPLWSRRAFLAAASCQPADARRHWYQAHEAHLDPLDKAVVRWAAANPFA